MRKISFACLLAVCVAFCLYTEAYADTTARKAALAASASAKSRQRKLPPPSSFYAKSPTLPAGAISVETDGTGEGMDLDDYAEAPVSLIADPIEPWNRFWFHFNDIFYLYIARPVYNGWTFITPRFLRTGISNLYHNSLFPMRFVNCILQGRFLGAGVEFSRFMMNVMGGAGLVDLSSKKKTIVPVDPSGEDFGQTLGYWGIGQGFYIVWPFIGPSSLRDSIGRVGDYFTEPTTFIQPWTVAWGTSVGMRFNEVGEVLPTYEDIRSISVDPYIAMREAYASFRKTQIDR